MKTWAPERSYPSLRGHPPLFEFTNDPDRSDVPPPPATNIRLTVPPEYEWVFPTTPLGYWLGATIEPGAPALHLDGVRYPLGTEAGYDGQTDQQAFERHVQDVLQVTFYCEGTARKWYDYTTKTEQQLKNAGLSVDFEALYERPVAERTRAYLQAAPGVQTVAEMVSAPRWPLEAYIEPTAERAPALPFLSRDLATIRTADETALERGPDLEAVRDDDAQLNSSGVVSSTPFRGTSPKPPRPSRSTDTDADSPSGAARYATPLVSLPETAAVTPVWIGEGFAADAFNVSTAAYQHRLVEQSGENDGAISVDVIINDREMADEAAVSELYGDRERLPFEVTLHDEQDRAGLATIFEQDTDFIHYVGHVDPDGFRCADGHLGGDEFGRVGTTTFLLNACCSYEQGCRLIENGAVSGIVTLNDVLSPLATEIGKTAAQLLNHGYPIDATTHLIRELEAAGHYYGMVGDPKATVAQYQSGAPEIARISTTNDGAFLIWSEAVTNVGYRLGCVMSPFFPDECHYLCPDTLGPWRVEDNQAVAAYLQSEHIAAPIDGELYWTEDLTIADLRELLETEDE